VQGGDPGFDQGVDFWYRGVPIDIKGKGRNADIKPHYDHMVLAYQCEPVFNATAYIFCSYNFRTETVEVCGWYPRRMLHRIAKYCPVGGRRHQDNGGSWLIDEAVDQLKKYLGTFCTDDTGPGHGGRHPQCRPEGYTGIQRRGVHLPLNARYK
jgi:hypothetical protein